MRYMLDTNICIYLITGHPPQVLQRMAQLHVGDVVMSSITLAELRAGVERRATERAQNERALAALVARVPMLPFGEPAAICFGQLCAAVPERARSSLDRLIAAHALSAGITLVTNNERDFRVYPGLSIENWAAPLQ